jgi:heterodisulfide reductase subunit C
MSGLDEVMEDIPECIYCGNSEGFCLGAHSFGYTKRYILKKGLKYTMFFREKPILTENITCMTCFYCINVNSNRYKKIERIYNHVIQTGKYYKKQKDFDRDWILTDRKKKNV